MTADKLREMVDRFQEDFCGYVGPYTSLVASSMMGKSRLMKEMSKHVPCVYICLRSAATGYPLRSPQIADWIEEPLNKMLPPGKKGLIKVDFENNLPTLKYAAFLLSLVTSLAKLASTASDCRFETDLHIKRTELSWMWEFFADLPNVQTEEANLNFWNEVTSKATEIFTENSSTPKHYVLTEFPYQFDWRCRRLESAFGRWIKNSGDRFTLILLFDEVGSMYDFSAYDNKRIVSEGCYNEQSDRTAPYEGETSYPFSNFRAVRRALRSPLLCDQQPRIFGLFVDTAYRIVADFEPQEAFNASSRMFSNYPAGSNQFKPIFEFTSLDAHARLLCRGPCLSDVDDVSDPERLIKFGRAGWYSTYEGKMANGKHYFDMQTLTNLAGNKLLCVPPNSKPDLELLVSTERPGLSSQLRLKLLALLGVRLDLAPDPYTTEARDLVARHLGVLVDIKPERQYHKTVYASEPILATVAAEHIASIGWHAPLMALCHYVNSAVVTSSGFRGELLTKIICLMSMDDVLKSLNSLPNSPESKQKKSQQSSSNVERQLSSQSSNRSSALSPGSTPELRSTTPDRWPFTQPVKVAQFLDHLLVAPEGYDSFSSALRHKKDLSVNSAKLERFLEGHVFFNHFMRVNFGLSIEVLAHSWNRGAALSCNDTWHFDHAIPVMLAEPGTDTAFGPMFDSWNDDEIKEGCQHISAIFIQSRNPIDAADDAMSGATNCPTPENFDNKKEFDEAKNIYLSIFQDFGLVHGTDDGTVTIMGRHKTHQEREYPQIVVTVKGFDCKTYKCLGISDPGSDDNTKTEFAQRQVIQRSIEQLKKAVGLHDKDRLNEKPSVSGVKEGLYYSFGHPEEVYLKNWEAMNESRETRVEMSDAGLTGMPSIVVSDREDESADV